MNSKIAFRAAFGGLIAAFSLILMLLTRIVPFSEQALPAIAGALLIGAVIELGVGTAAVTFAAVGLLSALFALQNGAAVYYLLLFGQYPIVKNLIERIGNKPVQWILKFLDFNLFAAAAYALIAVLTGVPDSILRYGLPVVFALVNAVFVMYDLALSRLVVLYVMRIRRLIRK